MKGLNSYFVPKRGFVFATVIVLIAFGVAYSFWYVPQNEAELQNKEFRCLQDLERNIRDKIDNSEALLNTLAENLKNPGKTYDKDKIIKYIHSYPTTYFSLTVNTNAVRPKALGGQAAAGDTSIIITDQSVVVRRRLNTVVIDVRYTLDQFFKPLFRSDLFDQYIVFKQPAVIYQTFPSGTAKVIADSLKTEKSAFLRNQVKELSLGGTVYKLFVQQIVPSAGSEITIAGLLKKTSYEQQRN